MFLYSMIKSKAKIKRNIKGGTHHQELRYELSWENVQFIYYTSSSAYIQILNSIRVLWLESSALQPIMQVNTRNSSFPTRVKSLYLCFSLQLLLHTLASLTLTYHDVFMIPCTWGNFLSLLFSKWHRPDYSSEQFHGFHRQSSSSQPN